MWIKGAPIYKYIYLKSSKEDKTTKSLSSSVLSISDSPLSRSPKKPFNLYRPIWSGDTNFRQFQKCFTLYFCSFEPIFTQRDKGWFPLSRFAVSINPIIMNKKRLESNVVYVQVIFFVKVQRRNSPVICQGGFVFLLNFGKDFFCVWFLEIWKMATFFDRTSSQISFQINNIKSYNNNQMVVLLFVQVKSAAADCEIFISWINISIIWMIFATRWKRATWVTYTASLKVTGTIFTHFLNFIGK